MKPVMFIAVMVVLFSIVGCTAPDIANSSSLISSGDYDAVSLDVAMDSKGASNIVWSEEINSNTSRLVYAYVKEGETPNPLIIDPGSGIQYEYPQIASADDGKIYLVWEKTDHNEATYTTCWATLEFDTSDAPECTPLDGPTSIAARPTEHPVISSNGTAVYAAYFSVEGAGNRTIGTIRLDDGSDAVLTTFSTSDTTEIFVNLDIVIAPEGVFHLVVLHRYSLGGSDFYYKLHYANNYGGSVNNHTRTFSDNINLSAVSIAVDPNTNETVYLAFTQDYDSIYQMTVADHGEGAVGTDSVLADNNWNIPGPPALYVSTSVFIFFSGKSDSVSNQEVWYVNDVDPGTDPVQVTDNTWDDSFPRVSRIDDQG